MSFSAEIKDFLGAAKGVYGAIDDAQNSKQRRAYMQAQTDKLNYDLNDPTAKEQKKANLAATKASTAATMRAVNDPYRDKKAQAEIDALKQRTDYYYAQNSGLIADERKRLSAPPSNPVADSIAAPPARLKPAIGVQPPAPATPAPPAAPAVGPQASLLDEEPQEGMQPAAFAANGGMVQKFEGGGMVDEDVDPDDEDDILAPAVGSTDVSAQSRTDQPAPTDSGSGAEAVSAGLKYGLTQVGHTGIPTAVRSRRLQALYRGVGKAPAEDMAAIYKKIDPNNEMGESERNMHALSAIYRYKMNAGDEQGAQRAAFQMLQHYRFASQRYAAIAAAAAEQGDLDGAAKAAMKAYANIPDGKGLKVAKNEKGQLTYSVIDEATGKVTSQGIATPQQLAAHAMGVAEKGFDQFLLSAAGQRAAAATGAGRSGGKSGGAPKETDKEKALASLDQAYTKAFPAKGDQPMLNPDEERVVKGNAYRVYTTNPGLTHDEAMDVTKRLISPNKQNPDEVGFASKKLEDGEGYLVKVGKGAPLRISEQDFDSMASIRAAKLEELKKGKKDSGPGFIRESIDAAGKYVSNKADEFVRDNPETVARTKSAINTGVRAIGDATDWVKRKAPEAAGAITDMAIGGPSGFAARQIKRRLED